jgi:hypothetical protein
MPSGRAIRTTHNRSAGRNRGSESRSIA